MLQTAQNVSRQNTQAAQVRKSAPLPSSKQRHIESPLAHMQHGQGNQAMLRLLGEGVLQKKLTINQPGDANEQEADRVSEQVMRMPAPATIQGLPATPCMGFRTSVQRCSCAASSSSGGDCDECKSKAMQLQRSSTAALPGSEAPPIVHDVLRSPGQPLDKTTRSFMEPRFGRDFSDVRVHTDVTAAASAQAVNALAYTAGKDIVFRSGQYAPTTHFGQKLIAHELSHVMQQSDSRPEPTRAVRSEHSSPAPVRMRLQRFTGCTRGQDASIERARKHAMEKVRAAIVAVTAVGLGVPTATQAGAFRRHFGTLVAADVGTVLGRFINILARLANTANFQCDTAASFAHCGPPNEWCAGTACPDMAAVSRLCPGFFRSDADACAEPSETEVLIHESARAAGCCPPDIQRGTAGYPPPTPGVLTNVFSYTGLTHAL
jgi:hypothetical protein